VGVSRPIDAIFHCSQGNWHIHWHIESLVRVLCPLVISFLINWCFHVWYIWIVSNIAKEINNHLVDTIVKLISPWHISEASHSFASLNYQVKTYDKPYLVHFRRKKSTWAFNSCVSSYFLICYSPCFSLCIYSIHFPSSSKIHYWTFCGVVTRSTCLTKLFSSFFCHGL